MVNSRSYLRREKNGTPSRTASRVFMSRDENAVRPLEIDRLDVVLAPGRDVVDDAELAARRLDPALDGGEQVALAAEMVEDADFALVEPPLLEDALLPDRGDEPRGDLGPADDDGDLLMGHDVDPQIDRAARVVEDLAGESDLGPRVAQPPQAFRQGRQVGGETAGDVDVADLALHPLEDGTLGDLGLPLDLEPADPEALPILGLEDEVGGGPGLPPDVAHDDGVEVALLSQARPDLRDGLGDAVLLKETAGPERCQARGQARRRGLRAPEADGVDEDVPDEGEEEGDPVAALPRHPDVGEQARGEDLLDGLVDEPGREGVARPDGDEVEETRIPGLAVDLDDDAFDDRRAALLGREDPRPREGQKKGEDRGNPGPAGLPERTRSACGT